VPIITTTIDRDQRDGLYELIRNHLGSIEDFWVALERTKDFAKAEQLGLEFAEDLRLLRDIGWGEEDEREMFDLTMPTHDFMELLKRLHEEAGQVFIESGIETRTSREDAETDRRFQLGYETCEKVLAELDSQPEQSAARGHRGGGRARERLHFPQSNPPGLNHSILTGTVIDGPRLARSLVDEPIILLEIEFPVADPERPQMLWTWSSCQVEVLDALAQRHNVRKLQHGDSLLVSGQLSNRLKTETGFVGKRDVIVASLIHSASPPDPEEFVVGGKRFQP
jgi:hypothetical protein